MPQQPDFDDTPLPGIGHDDGVEHTRTSPPGQPPRPPLQVFVSYKEKDKASAIGIKQQLRKFGAGNIDVFVAADEPAGIEWRKLILR